MPRATIATRAAGMAPDRMMEGRRSGTGAFPPRKSRKWHPRSQDRLQWASATWDPLHFDAEGARMYGRMFAAARAAGQSIRSPLADLLIASTAAANNLALYTRNPSDFEALKGIIKVVHL